MYEIFTEQRNAPNVTSALSILTDLTQATVDDARAIGMHGVADEAQRLFLSGVLTFPASATVKHPDRVKRWAAEHYPPDGWPTAQQHSEMFSHHDVARMFVVCGARSGNVAAFDFDQAGYFEQWAALLPDELYDRLYVEQSQRSGGYHVAVKTTESVLSCCPARDPRKPDGTDGNIRIEVRGEGNGFTAAPSVGYQRIQGDLAALPMLTPDEYRMLIDAAAMFNECAPRPQPERRARTVRPADEDELPGTRYNRESIQDDVLDLFARHGWTIGRRSGGTVSITRPGATSETSGNVNADGVTHVFSSNTPFEPSVAGHGNPHAPFAAYAILEHGGDFSEAGRTLFARYNPPATRREKGSIPGADAPLGTAPESPGDAPKKAAKRPPQRDDLIALAEDAELFHTPQGIPYATFAVGDHCETWRLASRGFREWLAHRFYREHGGSANTQAVQDAITALAGRARYDGLERSVHIRLAEHDGTIYLDLCDGSWRVVAIDAMGWRIVNSRDVPVRFRRSKGMLALPTPADGVTLATLRSFINLTDADWILFVAALIAALRPQGPYPALGVFGEQGSAKSTLVRIARSLIDPNAAALRTMPRDERDLMIAATNSWYLTFDNVSRIQDWQSDAFCRLATGGGFATRELYADDEETILDAQRPVIVNGITELATRSDLLDRLIPLNLQTIPDDKRRSEEALWLAFEQVRPGIIGALLTAVSTALRNLPTTRLTVLPRMADFALWVAAAAPALGFTVDDFLRAYSRNRAIAHELAVEASPVADNLIAFVKSAGQWEGRASALLTELASHVDEATRKQRGWPTDAARLSAELKRIAPNLRAVGVSVAWDRSQRARTIRLVWIDTARKEDRGKTASSASSASRDTDEGSDAKQNQHDATHDATEHNDADSVKGEESASHDKTSEGKGNDAHDAHDAEKPPSSSRTSRPITDRDLPHLFPGDREAATDD